MLKLRKRKVVIVKSKKRPTNEYAFVLYIEEER